MTLEDAEIVELPRGELILRTDPMQPQEPAPRVGNLQNRIDILNATAGAIIEMGPKAVLNLGVAAPLRDDADRTFDIEGLAQFNYFY